MDWLVSFEKLDDENKANIFNMFGNEIYIYLTIVVMLFKILKSFTHEEYIQRKQSLQLIIRVEVTKTILFCPSRVSG